MNAVYVDSAMPDDQRRRHLYEGQLFVFSTRASTRALCNFARELTEEAFAPLDPRDAQAALPVEQFVEILTDLKPRFIHHPRSKGLIQTILEDFGCDMHRTYFDVPRLRTVLLRRLFDVWAGLPIQTPSRHVVLDTDVPAELLAASLRTRVRPQHGVSSALLESAGVQQLGRL